MTELFFENFDEGTAGRGGVPRDSRGRALLKPKGLEHTDVRVAYSPASGLAEHISDSSHFHRWEMRYLAKGMGLRQDLARLAASEVYSTGLYASFQRGEKARSGRALDSIIERALDAVQIHEKADYGTAFHQHTEPGAPRPTDPEMARDVESFEEKLRTEAITLLGTEQFTVNDITMSAGTFDHTVEVLGHPLLTGRVVADKKTGRVSPHEWAVQIASYANGCPYDIHEDVRLEWEAPVNLKWGLVIHTGALTGKTELYPVDLEMGWEMAQHAAAVRDYHDDKSVLGTYTPASFEQRLEACKTKQDARTLWKSLPDGPQKNLVADKAVLLP